MNKERCAEIEFLRGELVGPARPLDNSKSPIIVSIDSQGCFRLAEEPCETLYYQCEGSDVLQEVVHYRSETPMQRYGVGMLYPQGYKTGAINNAAGDKKAVSEENSDGEEIENATNETAHGPASDLNTPDSANESTNWEDGFEGPSSEADDDDFEVSSDDMYQPSVMGISFCLEDGEGEFIVALPPIKKFFWQESEATGFPVNGRYERCFKVLSKEGREHRVAVWRRVPATTEATFERFQLTSLIHGKSESRNLNLAGNTDLKIQVFPRRMHGKWIITCVLRNIKDAARVSSIEEQIRSILFQAYFEVRVHGGAAFSRYPESVRPFSQLDDDEKTLALLYRDEATWAIGHGCAAGWEGVNGSLPDVVYADVMPAVELPSMTPDITDRNGVPITLSMRELASLPSSLGYEQGWESLDRLASEFAEWIETRCASKDSLLSADLREVASHHLLGCRAALTRIRTGISILKKDKAALDAFRLANQAMLLQQIASKQIARRPLIRRNDYVTAGEVLDGKPRTPWDVWVNGSEEKRIGNWRAFQAAFFLMSIAGLVDESCEDREIVDLIWFPTGGGKTEAYLAVAAFYMFYQRLIANPKDKWHRDGTNVFMRYTLRMLTTQQFQRAASLICAMEQIRMHRKDDPTAPQLGETRFSLGLWIGQGGSPNKWADASSAIQKYAKDDVAGNPLVLTECPWCRSEIGRLGHAEGGYRRRGSGNSLNGLAGFGGFNVKPQQPYLKCSDPCCEYGGERDKLPVEVIDEAIYAEPPSMFIGTADKFAMMAWKPETGALFGLQHDKKKDGHVTRIRMPPGLIIQDEFHLISGPLGTIYGLYEGIVEKLCTLEGRSHFFRPKIVASTATIRGAKEQVKAVYARDRFQLFPSPGLDMGDSFFGRYAQNDNGNLAQGRLYLGIHAIGYRSFLTAQVRAFSAALFRASMFEDDKKDAWWTLLAFYNSLRELGGAQTLFQSDIAARMKDYSLRYGLKASQRPRYLNRVAELTSRQSQAQLVELMDRLALNWNSPQSLDVCLASNIIEVGVDIDRLSLMAVVGQPKSTAQYIQVTGRVGRRWMERPGLILSMFNPAKSRDRSHYEQFHSYHRRLYECVEPTSATPFSVEAVKRAFAGVLLVWARQCYDASSPGEAYGDYATYLDEALELLLVRCKVIMALQPAESDRVCETMKLVHQDLKSKWQANPQEWWSYPQKNEGEYLMLWPSMFATGSQRRKGVKVLSSMRNVDGTARSEISSNYMEHMDDGQ